MLRLLIITTVIAAAAAASLGNKDLLERLLRVLVEDEKPSYKKRGMSSFVYDASNGEITIGFFICTKGDHKKKCDNMDGHETWIYDAETQELKTSKYNAYAENTKGWDEAPFKVLSPALEDGKKYVVMTCVKTKQGVYINCNAMELTEGEPTSEFYSFSHPGVDGWDKFEFALPANSQPQVLEADYIPR